MKIKKSVETEKFKGEDNMKVLESSMSGAIEKLIEAKGLDTSGVLFANPREIRKQQREIDNWDGPIVFFSPATLETFKNQSLYWSKMKKYFLRNDVVFCDMLEGIVHFAEMVEKAKARKADNRRLFDNKKEDLAKIGRLLHDMEPNKSSFVKKRAMMEAEKEFGKMKDDVAMIEFLLNAQAKLQSEPESVSLKIKGVGCDIEGTLLIDDKINQEVLDMLQVCEKDGMPITLWTGGDVQKLTAQLKEFGVNYPVVSKYNYRWGEVEMAIDDLPQKEFSERYKIFPKKYKQI